MDQRDQQRARGVALRLVLVHQDLAAAAVEVVVAGTEEEAVEACVHQFRARIVNKSNNNF